MVEEDRVNPYSSKIDMDLEEEKEDKLEASAWVEKENKRPKTIYMPKKVKERTLQLMPCRSQYFPDMRHSFIQERVKEEERSLTYL